MTDRWANNHLGVRALSSGTRRVRKSSVSIGGARYGGIRLLGRDGETVYVRCADAWGVSYYATTKDGQSLGVLQLLKGIE